MTNKDKYELFCQQTYVPIYSKPWWMDVVCGGPDNWDVWLDESGDDVLAAMPYYMERRGAAGEYRYITKAPLTQNNGIIFKEADRKRVTSAEFEEKIIQAACKYIASLGLDVYEQQYAPTFQNWSPFFWNNYTCVLRYTFIIEDTLDLRAVYDNFSSKYRNKIKKGQLAAQVDEQISCKEFYREHEKVFLRQGKQCPFSYDLWVKLHEACVEHGAGRAMCARDAEGNVHAVLFLVWDERSVYQLLGGYMQEFASSQAYPALIYHGIETAHKMGRAYDFEGSMIQPIAVAFRQFGGVPKPYYRIRKVFNPTIVRREAEDYILRLQAEGAEG